MTHDRRRLSLIALTVSALVVTPVATAAVAQTTPPPAVTSEPSAPENAPSAKAHGKHMTLADRFAAANTTHDGHLTLDQARAGMTMAARHFTAMDKDNKGYVTLADIHAYLKEQRAARRKPAAEETPNNG